MTIEGSEVISVTSMSWTSFEAFIESVYGRPYDFVESQECHNDTDYLFHAKKGSLLYYQESIDKFVNTEPEVTEYSTYPVSCGAYALFQDLVNRDFITEGCYLIRVSW